MKKPRKYVTITFVYEARNYPMGDQVARNVVGKPHGSSGMGFGLRDLNFTFRELPKAITAFKKLQKMKFPYERVSLNYD